MTKKKVRHDLIHTLIQTNHALLQYFVAVDDDIASCVLVNATVLLMVILKVFLCP